MGYRPDMDQPSQPALPPPAAAPDFEALLWDLFLRLMDVPGDRLEAEFLDAQRRMCRALELDRSALWQTRVGSPGGLFVTHVYDAGHDSDQADSVDGSVARPEGSAFLLSDGAVVSKNADAATLFPWLTERMFAGETVVLPRVDNPPPGAERDLEVIRGFGTRSTVIVPLKAYGQILGCLSFATTRTARRWPGSTRGAVRTRGAGLREGARQAGKRNASSGQRLETSGDSGTNCSTTTCTCATRSGSGGTRRRSWGRVPPSGAPSSWSARWLRPERRCCCSAKRARARSASPRPFTS